MDTNVQEIWKDIPGYEGLFQASNLGRVCKIIVQRKVLTPTPDEKGYLKTRLFVDNDNFQPKRIHRLVAQSFIPNPENYDQVNHINGIKSDNHVENLEWCNNSQNQIHAIKTGLRKTKYENCKLSKKVMNTETGIQYACAKDAFKEEVNPKSYEWFCKQIRDNNSKYIYV